MKIHKVRAVAIQPIEMLRYPRTAAMGKLHCSIASAWQSRLWAATDLPAVTERAD